MPPQKHRKKPFSTKLKKKQLQEKREKRRDKDEYEHSAHHLDDRDLEIDGEGGTDSDSAPAVAKLNHQPQGKIKGYDQNRYKLHFFQESKDIIEKKKALAREPFQMVSERNLEINLDEIYQPGSVLDLPKRPKWNYGNSKATLEQREENYFREYLDNILEKYSSEELSYFELNLETWRQLWRVIEMSDIILLITDIRHPAIHFSPALYNFVTEELKKHIILVLNKIDLAPPGLVVAWKHYFKEKFPNVHLICFTSYPKNEEEREADAKKVLRKKKRQGKHTAVGPLELYKACEGIVQGKVDLRSWREKIDLDMSSTELDSNEAMAEVKLEEGDGSFSHHEEYRDGVLTIGSCGYPNVGKSSLINGLMGKKVVSVSKTPGHTKHFQTIFLTPTVKLCDSPGLVFPSLIPRPMQILAGIYPISQVREPYTPVSFLSARMPVHKLLKLKHPEVVGFKATEEEEERLEWSGWDICEAWAQKRGYFTAKAARLDVYRAANSLLRLAVESRLCLCFRPPGYTASQEFWETNPETEEISRLQELHRHSCHSSGSEEEHFSESEGEKDQNELENGSDDDNIESENKETASYATNNPFALLGDE